MVKEAHGTLARSPALLEKPSHLGVLLAPGRWIPSMEGMQTLIRVVGGKAYP